MPTICYHYRCVSLPTLLWMLIDAIVGFDQRTHTHMLALFLSLRYLALFPLLSVSHKNPLADYFGINWNTDFNVLACSHFKGNINMKIVIVTQRLQKIPISTVLWLIEYFMLFFAFKVKNYFILMHEISSEMT